MTKTIDRIRKIEKESEVLNRAPQSVSNELRLAYLKIESMELRAKRELATARLWKTLLDAWVRTGSMVIELRPRLSIQDMCFDVKVAPNQTLSFTRVEGRPVVTGRPIQDFFNVKWEAERLARMAVDHEG